MASILDVLVVGAGPTGLTMAAELLRFGLTTRLVDKAPSPPPDASRAVALQPRTLEVFDAFGIVADIRSRGLAAEALNIVPSSGRRARIALSAFSKLETPYPEMRMVPQHETEAVLGERLTALGGRVERGVELVSYVPSEDRVSATLRGPSGDERVEARWIVGCDGSKSKVREGAGIAFEGDTYEDQCLVGDVLLEWDMPDGELYVMPARRGVLAAFPLPEAKRFRVIVIVPSSTLAQTRSLSQPDFEETLQRISPVPVRVVGSRFLSRYRLHHRVAARFHDGRVFLAGDAAHVHSPVGGQGMNTGIQDAYNLAWKLATVTAGRAPPWVLDTYEEERRRVALRLVGFTDRAFSFVAGHSVVGAIVRFAAPQVAPRLIGIAPVQRRMLGFVSQLHVRYRRSRLSRDAGPDRWPSTAVAPGDRAPDADLTTPTGKPSRIFDALRGTTHTLLLFADAETETLAEAGRALERLYPRDVRSIVIAAPGTAPGASAHADVGGVARKRYGVAAACAFLVRPDGYVGLRCAPPSLEALRGELALRFDPTAAKASERT